MNRAAFVSSLPIAHRPFSNVITTRTPCGQVVAKPHTRARYDALRASLPALSPAVTATLSTASAAATPFAIWAMLIGSATLGLTSQKFKWGRALSPPLVSTLCTLLLSNLTLIPATHPIYAAVLSYIVPLAVPLILLGTDLRRVFTQTGRLLPVFVVGTIATCIGTMAAWFLVPMQTLGSAAWKIAAALTARHIGGAVNYVAVADATAAPADVVTAALTADNVVVAIYFVLLLLLARGVNQPPLRKGVVIADAKDDEEMEDSEEASGKFQISKAGTSVFISALMCTVASFLSKLIPISLGIIPIVTAVVVMTATLFSKQLQPYRKTASTVGMFFMQIFFAVAGAGGSLISVVQRAPVLLVFSTVQLAVHLSVFLLAAKVLRFHRAEVLIASNANVGGPGTAAAMAGSKSWDRLVAPALLVGVFGYAIATFVSLGLGYGVLRVL